MLAYGKWNRHVYILASQEEGIRQDIIVNHKIQGASIEEVVLAVQANTVKLHLCIDYEQPEEEAFWYKCQTVYTADGSTGFYNIPQNGDCVELYIPRDNSENGYVKTVVRKDGENNLKTQNPDVKYWHKLTYTAPVPTSQGGRLPL